MNSPRFSLYKDPHLPIRCNEESIQTGQTIIGWWIYDRPHDCFTYPDLTRLSVFGWISSGVLMLLCWPLMCLPCIFSKCYEGYQIPVYSDGYSPLPSAPPLQENEMIKS